MKSNSAINQLFTYQSCPPAAALASVVESFWLLKNHSGAAQSLIILPDGRVDVFFSYADTEPLRATLLGLGTAPDATVVAPGAVMFAVSLRPLAVEYVLQTSVAAILNTARALPAGFWGIARADLTTLAAFQQQVETQLQVLVNKDIDKRKQRLFDLLYATDGAMLVRELADQAAWSSRQINRYFQERLGLSLKAYGNILRFRASFQHLREGRLFPELNYADQPHFIKEVRKLAGAKPTELIQNLDGRFIQFSDLPAE